MISSFMPFSFVHRSQPGSMLLDVWVVSWRSSQRLACFLNHMSKKGHLDLVFQTGCKIFRERKIDLILTDSEGDKFAEIKSPSKKLVLKKTYVVFLDEKSNYANALSVKLISLFFIMLITHWEKLLDSDWLRHCEFIHNLRANYRSQGQNL